MKYTQLGDSDLTVSRVGLGSLSFGHPTKGIQDKDLIHNIIDYALDHGINLIDTAEEYAKGKSEEHIGAVLQQRGNREEVIISTKVSPVHLSSYMIKKACNKSLERLKTGYIDIYIIHWPWAYFPLIETMQACDELLQEGKIRYVGLSNFQNCLFDQAKNYLTNPTKLILHQLGYSLSFRNIEHEILPYMRKQDVPIMAWSPLDSGFLTAKYDASTEFPKNDFRKHFPLFKHRENFTQAKPLFQKMKQLADKYQATPAQVALNWLLYQEDIIPIPGAKSIKHVKSNISAVEWDLTEKEWQKLTRLSNEMNLNRF